MDSIPVSVREQVFRYFWGRKLIIATMHGKEQIISPFVEKNLRVKTEVLRGFNTDQFGTFSGEIERKGTSVETLRKKLRTALLWSGETLGIASEGSFGPHPYYTFLPVDAEHVMLIDTVHDLEIIGSELSPDTNFHSSVVSDWTSVENFARVSGFPDHGIILKTSHGEVFKEIRDLERLQQVADEILGRGTPLTVETDMRAMRNPTRMKVIGKATENLVTSIFCLCPLCATPGFKIAASITGLPCQLCGTPTTLVVRHVFECAKCLHTEERKAVQENHLADPQYCDHCNP